MHVHRFLEIFHNHYEVLVDHQKQHRKQMHTVQEEIEKPLKNVLYHRTSSEPKETKEITESDEDQYYESYRNLMYCFNKNAYDFGNQQLSIKIYAFLYACNTHAVITQLQFFSEQILHFNESIVGVQPHCYLSSPVASGYLVFRRAVALV